LNIEVSEDINADIITASIRPLAPFGMSFTTSRG